MNDNVLLFLLNNVFVNMYSNSTLKSTNIPSRMASLSTVSVSTPFQIVKKEVINDWDKFCEESLDVARLTMRRKAPKRYHNVNDGVQLISRFIVEQGWQAFDALALAFGAGMP